MKGLFGSHINVTAKVLDMRLERQNLVMGNIANANTPEYKPRKLEFEDKLQTALALNMKGKLTKTNDMHMPAEFDPNGFKGNGLKEFRPRYVYGEDSVDLEKEVTTMAKNTMMYNALTSVIKKNFTGIQHAIQEGAK
ncbi:flagellar basal body rod protein FlgB [Salidesulfovibrio onnuriiensis]|uniref:flagellar basal body rod protein FlgB n=1 Tax=Salidesulfovibrio onnuriiensis TaxID=2583823 RepID=UPI0011C81EB1|nr:flagellar basal body rod protein FlgB [Salidesulfovibrio onnuriiensis]